MTDHRTLATLSRLQEVIDEVARQVHEVITVEVGDEDRIPLLEGITTIEVGSQHLSLEITRAAGELPRVVEL